MQIPLSQPYIDQEEIDAVVAVLKSSRLSLGPKLTEFEELFAQLCGVPYGVAVNSGTSGLHLCVKALDIGPGDEVITTPFSFIASANCILYEGATPVFVDVEEETFGLDPNLIESALSEKTKAMVPVHVFGQCCNMSEILRLAQKHNLAVIEDACEAPLARHQGQLSGAMGISSVFAFYPNKQMTTGEGGMILTHDEQQYELFKSYRNQGRGNNMQWLSHDRLGYNYRISELTAALGIVQTKKLPEIIKIRQQKAAFYQEILADIEGITLPKVAPGNEHSWFVFSLRVDASIRDEVLKQLNQRGVQSKAYFFPCIHQQKFYRETFNHPDGAFPVAEKLSREMIILPFFTAITEGQMMQVRDTLKEVLVGLSVS